MSPKRDLTLAVSMGRILSELRKKRYPGHGGQTQCANDFGIEISTWSQWERGKRIPSDEYQRKLAIFFEVSVSELRGDSKGVAEMKKSPPVAVGGGKEIDVEFIDAVFCVQEALANLGKHLAAGKSADDFQGIAKLQDTVQRLQERLATFRQTREIHRRTHRTA